MSRLVLALIGGLDVQGSDCIESVCAIYVSPSVSFTVKEGRTEVERKNWGSVKSLISLVPHESARRKHFGAVVRLRLCKIFFTGAE